MRGTSDASTAARRQPSGLTSSDKPRRIPEGKQNLRAACAVRLLEPDEPDEQQVGTPPSSLVPDRRNRRIRPRPRRSAPSGKSIGSSLLPRHEHRSHEGPPKKCSPCIRRSKQTCRNLVENRRGKAETAALGAAHGAGSRRSHRHLVCGVRQMGRYPRVEDGRCKALRCRLVRRQVEAQQRRSGWYRPRRTAPISDAAH